MMSAVTIVVLRKKRRRAVSNRDLLIFGSFGEVAKSSWRVRPKKGRDAPVGEDSKCHYL